MGDDGYGVDPCGSGTGGGEYLLLVLDNCQHVIDACARLASSLLSSCATLRILATSRESLRVSGETVWRLDSLQAEAGHRLFLERARQREPEFIPDAAADATIAELCERLDRLPLAIELAAARIGVMSPWEILADLEARLGALGGGSRLSPARHKTVRAAVEWSYELLDATEQRAFVGGFDSGAAMAVVPGLTVVALARVVDKSVVASGKTSHGTTRYRLLETVREPAHELLLASANSSRNAYLTSGALTRRDRGQRGGQPGDPSPDGAVRDSGYRPSAHALPGS